MAFLQTHDPGLKVLKHLEAGTVPSPWPHHAAGRENDRSQLPLRAHSLTGHVSQCPDAVYLSSGHLTQSGLHP